MTTAALVAASSPHGRQLDDGNFPGDAADRPGFNNSKPDAISLRAVDRLGNLSEPAVWTLPKEDIPRRSHHARRGENEEVRVR